MGIRLTEDVLARSHTGILTTLRADGRPVALPVWFVALDRAICLAAPSRTKKIRRVRRDPRASFLVEAGERWAELRAVHLSGTVEEVHDEEAKARIDAALDQKYDPFRTPRSDMPAAASDHYADRTFLRFVPEGRMLTWDNRRIEVKGPG